MEEIGPVYARSLFAVALELVMLDEIRDQRARVDLSDLLHR